MGVGAASRLGIYGGLDASGRLAWRPDLGSRADWTPVDGLRGVQIGGVGRIGRLLGVGTASRLEMYGGLDASGRLAWRPDWGCRADWTPLTGWRGVQIGNLGWIGRQWAVGAASRLGDLGRIGRQWVVGVASRLGL